MSKINIIQQKIKELSGGEFQKLVDGYLYKKYHFENICPLGSEDGTNKPTKGIPDSYVKLLNGKYIFIMCGSVKNNSFAKLKQDITSCLNSIERNLIEKIICIHTSTNITPKQQENLQNLVGDVSLKIIDLGTLSYDLLEKYPILCKDILGIPIDSYQFFSIEDFIKVYDKKVMASPLNTKFLFREDEVKELTKSILSTSVTVVVGAPGVGKTKLVLETCKLFNTNEYTIYCVKSNGASLEADMNIYFEDAGNYILFLDDINEIKDIDYILSFVQSRKDNINIKIVATVRDYAKTKILCTILKQFIPSVIELKNFSNEQIKQFLRKNYNITHPQYIDQICKISHGNIRLTVMAAQKATKEGYTAIEDSTQLFKSYYYDVLDSFNASKTTYCILFIIGFLGVTNYQLNKVIKELLNFFNIDKIVYSQECDKLVKLEILDKYEDEILKISDQNFKDFIIYYVLIEHKFISIEKLISLTFPKYSSHIVTVINMILEIFYDKNTLNYIKDNVTKAWQKADSNNEYYFVKYFSKLNLDKALLYVQNRISNIKANPYNLKDYNIQESNNNYSISSFEIEVLSNFKRTQYYNDAIELLLNILNKDSAYIHDVYITLSETYCYDEYSYSDDYEREYDIIDKIWDLTDYGTNVNETLLLISILQNYLQIERHITKNGLDNRTIIVQQIYITPTYGLYRLRRHIWNILYKLYRNNSYKKHIEKIIYNYNIYSSNKKNRTTIIQFDINYFCKLFVSRKKIINFKLAIILYKLRKIYKSFNIKNNKELQKYKKNNEYMYLINLFPIDNIYNKDWKLAEQERKEKIFKQIKYYTKYDWSKFINAYKKYEKCSYFASENLYIGLLDALELLENNQKQYLYVISLYIRKQIQTICAPNRIIKNLLKFVGIKQTKKIIMQCKKDERDLWLRTFYEEYPEENINESTCKQLVRYIKNTLNKEKPKIVPIFYLEKYKKIKPNIIKNIGETVCNMKNNNKVILDFFRTYLLQDDIEFLMNIFDNNLEILEKLAFKYMKANGSHSEYLFITLLKKNHNMWKIFTQEIDATYFKRTTLYIIFEYIWEQDNYQYFINMAISNIILKKQVHCLEFLAEEIFPRTQNNATNIIFEHQKKYISYFIQKNANNKEKIRIIFKIIVYQFNDLKEIYLKELLKLNSDINTFKSIPLEPMSYSWSGSLIPLLEQRINSLQSIKSILKGSKYIQHRNYIDNLINQKKEEIKKERINNFLENI